MNSPLLQAQSLTVHRGRTPVIHDVSFSLAPGVTALVGQNGAGKSTLMLALIGLIAPHSGGVLSRGASPFVSAERRRAFHGSLGWMPQQLSFPRRASVRDTVDYAAWLRGLDGDPSAAREAALAQVDMMHLQDRRAGRLSGGETRRLGLACALVGDPELLILDEPTVGLDPHQREEILETIVAAKTGRSILLSTHIVEDITQTADHVLGLVHGRVSVDAPWHELVPPGASVAAASDAVKAIIRPGVISG